MGDYRGITSMDVRPIILLRHGLVRLLDRMQPLLASEASESADF